jgi:tetratricopeptide (TPR) repeat protein
MPPPAKQKPNEACACGSGRKFKRCCGGGALSHAPPPPPQPAAAAAAPRGAGETPRAFLSRELALPAVARLLAEARAAQATKHWPRAARRVAAALALLGDALCACGTQRGDAPAGPVLLGDAVYCFLLAIQAHTHSGRLAEAEDCYARALALLQARPFWAKAMLCAAHTRWRDDAPLDEADVRVALPPPEDAAQLLRGVHGGMGLAYLQHGERSEAARAALEAGLDALEEEPPGSARDYAAAVLMENLGNSHGAARRAEAALACYLEALRLLARSGERGGEGDLLRRNLAELQASMAAPLVESTSEWLALYERMWASMPRRPDGSCARENRLDLVCRKALLKCDTRAQQHPWLCRAVALQDAPAALAAAGQRGCRACGARAQRGAAPLKKCSACCRVAYCSAACQRADWSARHKRWCAAAHADSDEAAVADALCVVCVRALVPSDDDDGDEAQLATLQLCGHLAHAACVPAAGSCPICTA